MDVGRAAPPRVPDFDGDGDLDLCSEGFFAFENSKTRTQRNLIKGPFHGIVRFFRNESGVGNLIMA